ncbi:unnamed protein product, partial [Brenthis ino]
MHVAQTSEPRLGKPICGIRFPYAAAVTPNQCKLCSAALRLDEHYHVERKQRFKRLITYDVKGLLRILFRSNYKKAK